MSADNLQFEIVRDGDRLEELAAAWTALWSRRNGLVFQSHPWVCAWWRTLPDRAGYRLCIVLAWQQDHLAAVMPLVISRRRGVRILEWAAQEVTDYCDAVAEPGSAEILRRMWAYISAEGGYDIVHLSHVLPDAEARALLHDLSPGALPLRDGYRTEASLRVRGTWPSGKAWFDKQSKKLRQNYRRGQKSLAERGRLAFRLLGADEPHGPVVERIAALKRAWLAANGKDHPLFDESAPMLSALITTLAELGALRIFVIECDSVPVAISVNLVHGDTMMAFLTSYDRDYERASPGVLLMMDYIQWSFDNGLRCVDFMRGDESFKFRFANESVMLGSFVGSRGPVGAAAQLLDRLAHKSIVTAKRVLARSNGARAHPAAGDA